MEGVGNFCRACLIQYDGPHELIQYTEKNRRQFVYSTGLQVKRNDSLTFQLCKECHANMKLSCKFKKMCRTSDKRFKNYVGLKEAGEVADFCTFLKNSDDTFRFPYMNAFSTPLQQKNSSRDEDNDSTCTSIRNFMRDILKPDEIPDTEARIIREVIAEEADILDDSLDSLWLQDDVPLEDFQLDFTLISPFSTPRSTSIRCTPVKSVEKHKYQFTPRKPVPFHDKDTKSLPILTDPDYMPKYQFSPKTVNLEEVVVAAKDIVNKNDECTDTIKIVEESDEAVKRTMEYVNNQLAAKKIVQIGNKRLNALTPDAIDRNLEEALKNDNIAECSLDDLIISPAPFRQPTATISTPTITNLLFGEKLDVSEDSQLMNRFLDVDIKIEPLEGDLRGNLEIPDTCFHNDTEGTSSAVNVPSSVKLNFYVEGNGNEENDKILETTKDIEKKDIQTAVSKEYDEEIYIIEDKDIKLEVEEVEMANVPEEPEKQPKFYCETCKREFRNLRGLQLHAKKIHGIETMTTRLKKHHILCKHCGKFVEASNYGRHTKSCDHMNKKSQELGFQCDICKLGFKLKQNIVSHMKTHMVIKSSENPTQKKQHVCSICGKISNSASNLRVHILRHEKKYIMHCAQCDKGFYRKQDMQNHMRTHTKEKPFSCDMCGKVYSRRDLLNTHVRSAHTGVKMYDCNFCGADFFSSSNLRTHKQQSQRCISSRDPNAPNKPNFRKRKLPQDPNVPNEQYTKEPQDPNALMAHNITAPQDPNALNEQNTKVPQDPNALNEQNTKVPQDPNALN